MSKRFTRVLLYLSLSVFLAFAISACAKKVKIAEKEVIAKPEKEAKPAEVAPAKPALTEEQLALKKKQEEERAKREATERVSEARERELLNRFLSEYVRFEFDEFNIKDSEKPILDRKKQWIMGHPTAKVLIEGHCDERGTSEYNLALGDRRANSCKQYLILLGVDSNRLSTISYGEEKPFDPGHNEDAWDKNRRGQFVVISQ